MARLVVPLLLEVLTSAAVVVDGGDAVVRGEVVGGGAVVGRAVHTPLCGALVRELCA